MMWSWNVTQPELIIKKKDVDLDSYSLQEARCANMCDNLLVVTSQGSHYHNHRMPCKLLRVPFSH